MMLTEGGDNCRALVIATANVWYYWNCVYMLTEGGDNCRALVNATANIWY